ncbi:MAG: YigZ family protein [Lachnospiraceae bacterium]|nr:YigZ family protein [Lachnospiraceae bacterium]
MSNELTAYRIAASAGEGEIEEKKSRFICHIRPVQSEEEALAFIEEMKKTYWDARHNCYAFILGKKQEIMRYSDDGEPGGTAGKPILEVLSGAGLCYTAAVVTRYFGGTLLGTGGLVRAYTQATQAGLAQSRLVWMCPGDQLTITADYTAMGKIRYAIEQMGMSPADMEYAADVTMNLIAPQELTEAVIKKVTEVSNGQAKIVRGDVTYFEQSTNKSDLT